MECHLYGSESLKTKKKNTGTNILSDGGDYRQLYGEMGMNDD